MAFVKLLFQRALCTSGRQIPKFGILFDIDGVIVRGNPYRPIFPQISGKAFRNVFKINEKLLKRLKTQFLIYLELKTPINEINQECQMYHFQDKFFEYANI